MCALRYTEWVKFSMGPEYKPDWSVKHGVELYDHWSDPKENRNQAENPKYKKNVEELSKLLHAGWREVPLEDYKYKPPTTRKTSALTSRAQTIHSFFMHTTFIYGVLILHLYCFNIV